MGIFDLRRIEGVADWLLEVRVEGALLGYVGRNPVVGTYRYYRGNDGCLAREGHDLDALLAPLGGYPRRRTSG